MPLEQLLKAHQPVKSSIDAMKAINIAKATTTIKIAAINARSTYLFGKDKTARVSDIKQGGIGDCWFLASLAGVVQKNPELIYKNIKAMGNGDFQVTLYEYFSHKPVIITVTDDDLNQSYLEYIGIGTSPQQYAHKTDGNWVGIYETAMAKYFHENKFGIYFPIQTPTSITDKDYIPSPQITPIMDYNSRNSKSEKQFGNWAEMGGSHSEIALSVITGEQSTTRGKDESGSFFTKNINLSNDIFTASTLRNPGGNGDVGTIIAGKNATGNDVILYYEHAYNIVEINNDSVKLYNPHGNNPNLGRELTGDGYIWITKQQFDENFRQISTTHKSI